MSGWQEDRLEGFSADRKNAFRLFLSQKEPNKISGCQVDPFTGTPYVIPTLVDSS